MHAVTVDVSMSDMEEARRFLHDRTVPAVSRAPGFVAGYWMARGEHRGRSLVVFDSEAAAKAMAERVPHVVPPSVTVEEVEVGELVAHAEKAAGAVA